jgi:ankyrin repeat protein
VCNEHAFCASSVFFASCGSDAGGAVCCGESDSQNGYTALMHAAGFDRAECVRLLIDAGADKDAKDNVRRRSLL